MSIFVTTYPAGDTTPGSTTFPGSFTVVGPSIFTPPQRRQIYFLEGSLRVSFLVNSTVWKDAGGVWHAQENPYDGDLAAATVVLHGATVVDDALAAELTAAGIGTVTEDS